MECSPFVGPGEWAGGKSYKTHQIHDFEASLVYSHCVKELSEYQGKFQIKMHLLPIAHACPSGSVHKYALSTVKAHLAFALSKVEA
jgi:hypothetical protein